MKKLKITETATYYYVSKFVFVLWATAVVTFFTVMAPPIVVFYTVMIGLIGAMLFLPACMLLNKI